MSIPQSCCKNCGFPEKSLPEVPVTSPVSHLLFSNDPPLHLEISAVRTTIHDAEVEIAHLDEILQKQQLVKQRREEFIRYLQAHRSIFSPIRRVPAELLSEIFLQCVWSNPEATLNVRKPPWVFGKVCRRWREITLSDPRLWNVIPRLNTNFRISLEKNYLALLSTTLRLSSNSLFHIDITTYLHPSTTNHPLIDVIAPFSNRWQELSLSSNPHSLCSLSPIRGSLDSLSRLKMRLFGNRSELNSLPSADTFEVAPRLRELQLELPALADNGSSDAFTFRLLNLPWGQLTTLSGSFMEIPFILDVLSNAPLLADCTFTNTIWGPVLEGRPPVTHHKLRKFALRGGVSTVSVIFLSGLLERLVFPSLERLRIDYEKVDLNTVLAFIRRACCPLTSLVLRVTAHDGELGVLFDALPLLTDLQLHGSSAELMTMLNVSGTEGDKRPLLPSLRHLSIQCDFTSYQITGMIKSRMNKPSVRPIDTIRLRFKDDSDKYWKVYFELEEWVVMPKEDAEYKKVVALRDKLQSIYDKRKNGNLEHEDISHLSDTLLSMEELEIPLGRYLHLSKICDVLLLLSTLDVEAPRIKNLTNKWRFALSEHLKAPRWRHGYRHYATELLYNRFGMEPS